MASVGEVANRRRSASSLPVDYDPLSFRASNDEVCSVESTSIIP